MTGSTHSGGPRTPAELFADAIQTEREASFFYKMMAEMTSDPEAHDALMTISADEASHAETLYGLYFELTGHGITESAPPRAEGEPDIFDFKATSRRDAFEFALRTEKSAADLYRSQAEESDDPKVATVFRLLAETEQDHASYMQLQLDRLATPDDI